MDRLPMTPKWRNGAGMAMILVLIAAWSVLAVTIGDRLVGLPVPLLILYYAVAGLAWILPLKPLLRWMETGRWRSGPPPRP
jgi:hypothetical protein